MPLTEQEKRSTPPILPAVVAAAVLIAAPMAASHEGLRTHPYLDPAGIPTVCYGETELAMRVYSADECGAMLRERLIKDYAPKIAACLPGLVNDAKANALGAFIDAAYNAGVAAVCSSRMARAARAGDLSAACNGFPGWYVTARGKVYAGLVARRKAEQRLCLVDTIPAVGSEPAPYLRWARPVDFQMCVKVKPGAQPPLLGPRPTNKVPFPRRPDTA